MSYARHILQQKDAANRSSEVLTIAQNDTRRKHAASWYMKKADIMATVFHADDFGIDADQARDILALSDACGGCGALSSVSIFANSVSFYEAGELARPYVEQGLLAIRPHINLVEGYPCEASDPENPLINNRGAFALDFVGLMRASIGPQHAELASAIRRECRAQINRFCSLFPQERTCLSLDSHQHVHMIPLVFDALMQAAQDCGCTVTSVRIPREPIAPHFLTPFGITRVMNANGVKDAVLATLSLRALKRLSPSCEMPLFCGVVLSGSMNRIDAKLVHALEKRAREQNSNLELLFHPIRMDASRCLDPQNIAFTKACCSPGRDAEARCVGDWHIGPDGNAIAP